MREAEAPELVSEDGGARPPAPRTLADRLRRGFYVSAGLFFVAVGLLGVVLPVLPTTPFLLLAAACFARSSDRLHRWLLENRLFGEYIRRYRAGEGMTRGSKIATLAMLWPTLGASAFLGVPDGLWWVRLILLAVGCGATYHIWRLKTAPTRPRRSA